jgi:stage IV sporulation protein FB
MPRLKISLVSVAVFILWVWFGKNPIITVSLFIAVMLHEISHILCCRLLGYHVSELKLTIFGGCLQIDPLFEANPGAEMIIAAAGPAINGLMVLGVGYLKFLGITHDYLSIWRQVNLLIGIINLLPAYPLDGGRIIHAWLSAKFGLKASARLSRMITAVVSVGFLLSGFIQFFIQRRGMYLIMIGGFLFLQFFFNKMPQLNSIWQISLHKKRRLNKKGFLNSRLVLVDSHTLLRLPLQYYGTDEYLFFYINYGENNYKLVSEQQAWDTLFNRGYNATFNEIDFFIEGKW